MAFCVVFTTNADVGAKLSWFEFSKVVFWM